MSNDVVVIMNISHNTTYHESLFLTKPTDTDIDQRTFKLLFWIRVLFQKILQHAHIYLHLFFSNFKIFSHFFFLAGISFLLCFHGWPGVIIINITIIIITVFYYILSMKAVLFFKKHLNMDKVLLLLYKISSINV
jgi:hypothetical protein